MARGVGWLNGLMVPVTAIILAVLIGVIVRATGADMGVAVQYGADQVPVGFDVEQFRTIGLVAGIGSFVAMFVGAIFGGMLGARWHDKLEAGTEVPEAHLRAA
jgi:MFS family permease